MKQHILKSHPPFFNAVLTGRKTAEIRKDDRGIQTGDVLCLREYEPKRRLYTGHQCTVQVIDTLRDYPGLQAGYVMLSIRLPISAGSFRAELAGKKG